MKRVILFLWIFGFCCGCRPPKTQESLFRSQMSRKTYHGTLPVLWKKVSSFFKDQGYYGAQDLPKDWKKRNKIFLASRMRFSKNQEYFLTTPFLRKKELYKIHIFKVKKDTFSFHFYYTILFENGDPLSLRDFRMEKKFASSL